MQEAAQEVQVYYAGSAQEGQKAGSLKNGIPLNIYFLKDLDISKNVFQNWTSESRLTSILLRNKVTMENIHWEEFTEYLLCVTLPYSDKSRKEAIPKSVLTLIQGKNLTSIQLFVIDLICTGKF